MRSIIPPASFTPGGCLADMSAELFRGDAENDPGFFMLVPEHLLGRTLVSADGGALVPRGERFIRGEPRLAVLSAHVAATDSIAGLVMLARRTTSGHNQRGLIKHKQ